MGHSFVGSGGILYYSGGLQIIVRDGVHACTCSTQSHAAVPSSRGLERRTHSSPHVYGPKSDHAGRSVIVTLGVHLDAEVPIQLESCVDCTWVLEALHAQMATRRLSMHLTASPGNPAIPGLAITE